jgi:hypothetical protein
MKKRTFVKPGAREQMKADPGSWHRTYDNDAKSVPAGYAVIRGFRFDFTSSDHHLGIWGSRATRA